MISPFQIPYDPRDMADLQARLEATRWADAVVDDWSQGTERGFLRELVRFWRDDYDWADRVRDLNRLPHFRTGIDGCDMHFLHFRSDRSDAVPLLLMNGWPSSFIEYGRIVPLLTAGSPAFHVVIPAMPGFGFSDRPDRPYAFEPAELFPKLMAKLGYGRFVAAGTDIGSGTATRIGLARPDLLRALHVSAVAPRPRPAGGPPPSQVEADYDERVEAWRREEGGYQAQQGTRPQTLAFALADSPVGLASWIVEKFRAWSDCAGDVLSVWPCETLLDNIMIYWTTNTIGSSVRYYYDAARLRPTIGADAFVRVPTGVATWPSDIALAPREVADRLYDVRRYSIPPRGGHFPAWEAPELYAEDIRELARIVAS